ncbi:MAG: GAF domain-containing sensor histidine kinase [Anaerolineae bacterium]|jgi:signal transduction histidine kinase
MNSGEAGLDRLKRVLEISRELTSTVALEPLLRKIVDVAVELTDSEAASILLLDEDNGERELRFFAVSSDSPQRLGEIRVPVEGSIAGAVLTEGEPAIVSDVRVDPRHYGGVGQLIDFETRSLLAVPLQIKDRRIGVLEVLNKRGDEEFNQEDTETLIALAAQAAVAIENARLVEQLRESYDRLGELDRLKSDFIAIASHELRTPLGLILGYARLLQNDAENTAAGQLKVVVRAASQLQGIIETMLNLRYLETGEMQMASAPFDLRREVNSACAAYRTITEAQGLELKADLPDDELTLVADREKVRLVLDNLISNAVKFTDRGGRVRVTAHSRGDEVEVEVADTGSGISPEELAQIFDRFYQIEDHMTRRHGGMGLGLSVVKELVEFHGGRVWVDSVPGQGSRFGFVLPKDCSVVSGS